MTKYALMFQKQLKREDDICPQPSELPPEEIHDYVLLEIDAYGVYLAVLDFLVRSHILSLISYENALIVILLIILDDEIVFPFLAFQHPFDGSILDLSEALPDDTDAFRGDELYGPARSFMERGCHGELFARAGRKVSLRKA